MTGMLPELEGWIKAAGAVVAVLMAVLVPVRSWLVEDRRFRAQTLEAIAAASRNTLGGLTGSSTVFADRLALTDVADALNRLAAILERILDADQAQTRDRLTEMLERFIDAQAERR